MQHPICTDVMPTPALPSDKCRYTGVFPFSCLPLRQHFDTLGAAAQDGAFAAAKRKSPPIQAPYLCLPKKTPLKKCLYAMYRASMLVATAMASSAQFVQRSIAPQPFHLQVWQ